MFYWCLDFAKYAFKEFKYLLRLLYGLCKCMLNVFSNVFIVCLVYF